MGSHLNPLSFAEYTGHLLLVPVVNKIHVLRHAQPL